MLKNTRSALFLSAIATLTLVACDAQQSPDTTSTSTVGDIAVADLIVTNAKVYLDGTSQWTASAFAVKDGTIMAVGDAAQMQAHEGTSTKTLDVAGKVVMPGLIDAHVHPWQGGEKMLYMCNFAFSSTPEEIAAKIGECASSPTAPEWIVGGQWSSNFFVDNDIPSPKGLLDAVSGDHPVFLDDDSAHHAWANSKALALAGITKDTPDPEGGVIVRDANGEPNGVLLERAGNLVGDLIPLYTPEEKIAAIDAVSKEANRFGVTAFGEARTPESAMAAYQTADERGLLTVHALIYQQSYGMAGPELEPVSAYDARAEKYDSPNTDPKAIKFFLDGVPTASRSAMMLDNYTTDDKHPHETKGMQMIPTEELFEKVAAFDKAGYRIKIHTAGDGSVQLALNAIENARKLNGSTKPISLAHAGYIAEEDLPRFAELDAVADFSPYLWFPRPIVDSVVQAVGEPRGGHYWPTKDLLAAGATVVGGSDWPSAAADMNPWPAIESLVTRKHPTNGSDATFWPEQAIPLDQAITLWTTQAARVIGLEGIAGEIKPGASADFIVLGVDPHTMDVSGISDIAPEQTWFRGVQTVGAQ